MTYNVFGGTLNFTQPPSPTAYLKLSHCSEVEPLRYTIELHQIYSVKGHIFVDHCVCFCEILAVASKEGTENARLGTRDGKKCRVGKRGTKLQDRETREKACMESHGVLHM